MITVYEAENIILEKSLIGEQEARVFDQAYGAVLAEDIVTDRDYPPADKALMDGITTIRMELYLLSSIPN